MADYYAHDCKRMISSNFVAFSEYMNFIRLSSHIYLYPQMGPPFLEMAAATQFWHVTAAVQPFKAVITKATARLLYAAVLLNFSWQPLCIMAASFVIVFFISHNSQVYRKKNNMNEHNMPVSLPVRTVYHIFIINYNKNWSYRLPQEAFQTVGIV